MTPPLPRVFGITAYKLFRFAQLASPLLLFVLLSALALGSSGALTLRSNCALALQQQLNAAASGSEVHVPACIYRQQVSITKPLTLIADPGAEIRGSDVWTDWRRSGSIWVSNLTLPIFPAHGACNPKSNERCLWPEQAFLDGQPLFQVAANPKAGQFAVDPERHVVLGDNPTGHMIEISTRTRWLVVGADHVTLQGFRMRHAANEAQTAAIDPQAHGYLTIRDSVLSDTSGNVVTVADSSHSKVLNNEIFHGGALGLHGGGKATVTDILIQGNKIHDNNTEDFDTSWEAGGLKITVSRNVTIDGNEVYNNNGPGIWFDIDCNNIKISNNRIHHNSIGIFYEISDDASIFDNKVWENGWQENSLGSGIYISSSRGANVHDNIVAWNGFGINVASDDRSQDSFQPEATHNAVYNNYVHDNIIIQTYDHSGASRALRWFQSWPGGDMLAVAKHNRGEYNGYWYGENEAPNRFRFTWGEKGRGRAEFAKLSAFNATPGDRNGYYLTTAKKNRILAKAGMPTAPENHNQENDKKKISLAICSHFNKIFTLFP